MHVGAILLKNTLSNKTHGVKILRIEAHRRERIEAGSSPVDSGCFSTGNPPGNSRFGAPVNNVYLVEKDARMYAEYPVSL